MNAFQQVGKPVYLSGGLFQEGLRRGDFNYGEVSDVANAVIDGVSGFQLKCYENIELTVVSMKLMDDICRSAEPFRMNHANFWRMVQEVSNGCQILHLIFALKMIITALPC